VDLFQIATTVLAIVALVLIISTLVYMVKMVFVKPPKKLRRTAQALKNLKQKINRK
jgi:hypothetical protein